MKKESSSIPDWVATEIKDASLNYIDDWQYSGYVLSTNKKESILDAQFYDALPDGRHIATLELPESIKTDSFINGDEYIFSFKAYKSSLSEKVTKYLNDEYSLSMKDIYRFELISSERIVD